MSNAQYLNSLYILWIHICSQKNIGLNVIYVLISQTLDKESNLFRVGFLTRKWEK